MGSTPHPMILRMAIRSYRALLFVVPAAFRIRHESALTAFFEEQAEEAFRDRGAAGVARCWSRAVVDIVTTAVGESTRRLRQRGRQESSGFQSLAAGLAGDLRHGARRLAHRPMFSICAVLLLAMGIGATTTLFSVAKAVLLQSLPYASPDELVRLRPLRPGADRHRSTFSEAEYLTFEARTEELVSLAAVEHVSMSIGTAEGPIQATGARTTANLLSTFGSATHLGRYFDAAEDQAGGPGVVVLSHGLWTRWFAGDPSILGRVLQIDAEPVEVVGVMPPRFRFPQPDTEFWLPLRLARASPEVNSGQYLNVFGRRSPEVTAARLQADLDRVASQITDESLTRYDGTRAVPIELRQDLVGAVRPSLLALVAAVVLVLVTVCFNLAGFLLAHAVARRTELAVRAALGATPRRILIEALAESVVLAGLGGVLGCLVAVVGVEALTGLEPSFLPRLEEIRVDGLVLVLAGVATTLVVLIFGVVPAVSLAHVQPGDALRAARGSVRGVVGRRFRGALVLLQVAASVTLLVGAGVMVQSMARLNRTDLRIRPDESLTFRLALPQARYAGADEVISFYTDFLQRIERLPDVESAGAVSILPMSGQQSLGYAWPDDHAPGAGTFPDELEMRRASPGYFEAIGLEILEGRTFRSEESGAGPMVVIISRMLAETLWPDQKAVGRRFQLGRLVGPDSPWRTVVGVVDDIYHTSPRDGLASTAYFPLGQLGTGWEMNVVVKTIGPTMGPLGGVRAELEAVDPEQPIFAVRPMATIVQDSTTLSRFSTSLLVGFSVLVLALAAIGLYGMLGHTTAQRRHELAVRAALGATRAKLISLVVREGIVLSAVGVALGLIGSAALTRFLSSQLFGVRALDPVALVLASIIVLATALAATLPPARRASTTQPASALRGD